MSFDGDSVNQGDSIGFAVADADSDLWREIRGDALDRYAE